MQHEGRNRNSKNNNSNTQQNSEYIGYEYKEMAVDKSMEPIYIDSYRSFGWQLDETKGVTPGIASSILRFKRDRRILNKAELTRLQRQFDSCAKEIVAMERSKHSTATMISLVIGLIGCAFLALSVFAITATPPNVILCIVFGLPGLICWVLPYFAYKRVIVRKASHVDPMIDMKYEEIYQVCEKANGLLH